LEDISFYQPDKLRTPTALVLRRRRLVARSGIPDRFRLPR